MTDLLQSYSVAEAVEACAQVCDDYLAWCGDDPDNEAVMAAREAVTNVASAIRALKIG